MISDDAARIDNILLEILGKAQGSQLCLVVDRDGIPIAGVSTEGGIDPILTQQLSALTGALYESAVEQGLSLDLGEVEFQFIEYTEGYFFARGAGHGLLLLFTSKDIEPTVIFKLMREYETIVCNLIENYSCEEPKELNDDIKALLSSEFMNFGNQ